MPLSFLAPVFLAGLAALAIPVLIHLANRPRKEVVEFPSLMFLERVEYQESSKRSLRDVVLFLLRCFALILLAGAFARPYLDRPDAPLVEPDGGREVVVLLDRSYSMGAESRMEEAREAASRVADGLQRGDRATLVLFDHAAAAANRATSEPAVLRSAIDTVRPGAGATRLGPALRLAESILAGSPLPRKELWILSDFQRRAWDPEAAVSLPAGTEIHPVPVGGALANVAVADVAVARERFSGRERGRITARVVNRGPDAVEVPVELVLDGRVAATRATGVPAGGAASATFDPVTLPDHPLRGGIQAGEDALPVDNAFHFVVAAGRNLRVLLVEPRGASGRSGLYLRSALAVGPDHDVAEVGAAGLDHAALAGAEVVILNDADFPSGETGRRLREWVEAGGGLVTILGERARGGSWGGIAEGLLPGAVGRTVDRAGDGGAGIAGVRYEHPVFQPFREPGAGDVTATRVYRYRGLDPAADATVLARYDDGAAAVAERAAGRGRVLVITSPWDGEWSDLVLQPAFVPLVHRLVRHASGRDAVPPWRTVGELADAGALLTAEVEEVASDGAGPVVLTPSGGRLPLRPGETVVRLDEQGVYEVRDPRTTRPPAYIAVNVDLAESELTAMDPAEVEAALAPGGGAPGVVALDPDDRERRQSLWWYFLAAAFILMAAETALSNRLSRRVMPVQSVESAA